MPKIKRANKNILQRPLAKIWAAIFASLGTQRKERPAMISISQEFRKVLKELYQLGGVEQKMHSILIANDWKRKLFCSKLPYVSKDKMDNITELGSK